jgi:short-subunit dehydrogenase
MANNWINSGWVLITGAAGGIGQALANEFHSKGARLILTDVAMDGLKKIADQLTSAGAEVVCFEHDVTDPQGWADIANQLEADDQMPRILVNNAGLAALGCALDLPIEAWQKVIDVDLWGVIHGCREFVPRMLASDKRCAVVNVASCAAYLGGPLSAPYFIAKAGVMRLTQSFQTEIDPRRVSFTVVCPGAVETGIGQTSAKLGGRAKETATVVDWLAPPGRSPATVAKRAVAGALKGKAVVNVFWEAGLLNLSTRFLPFQLIAWFSRRYFVWRFPKLAQGEKSSLAPGKGSG